MNTPQRFTKRLVTIEAAQLSETRPAVVIDWIRSNGGSAWIDETGSLSIRTLEGVMYANEGDWIIRGVQGEFYPCKPDIFEATYQPAQGGKIDPDTAAQVQEALADDRDFIIPQAWADTVTAEHDARSGTLRDALDATTSEDQPGHVAIYPYRTGEQADPTDAEVRAAARAVFETRDDPYDDTEWGELTSADRERWECYARAALVAAREVSGR